jgi:hypothetical protein
MTRLVLTVLALGALGCGGADAEQACADYLAAVDACYAQAGGSSNVPASYCDTYVGLTGGAARQATDTLECLAAVMTAGDCSDVPAANETRTSAEQQCT